MSYWIRTATKEGCANTEGTFYQEFLAWLAEHGKADEVINLTEFLEQRLGTPILSMETLPYAASPVLIGDTDWLLCYTPKECKGRSSCPKRRSCSE